MVRTPVPNEEFPNAPPRSEHEPNLLVGDARVPQTLPERAREPVLLAGGSVTGGTKPNCSQLELFFEGEGPKLKVAKEFAEEVIELRKGYKLTNVAVTKAMLKVLKEHYEELKEILEGLHVCKRLKEAEEIIKQLGGERQ